MDVLRGYALEAYDFYSYHHARGDPRSKDWPLVQNFAPTLALTAIYLSIVKFLPILMRNQKPFQLNRFMVVYNLALVALNFHIFKEIVIGSWNAGYSYICQPIKYSFDAHELRVAKAIWWFYISKLFEFMDTIIFILRKKNDQLSFLHVYHHATMFPLWWIGVKWVAGGQSFFGALLNSGIHVLMYLYYGLAAIGPHMQKYLKWKRYLTQMQLIQFFLGIANAYAGLYAQCDFPRWMGYALMFYASSIAALFFNFYFQAYISGKRQPGGAASGSSSGDVEKKKKKSAKAE
ncbi:very long chain fatty acid elongase 4-like [Convolutriloba macropyga]|uniref:very long chain fatty acid elongase 4-like n=1 Tax=Convolutriloba macropyga TaxID=536237 RepID=UPI003F529057